MQVGDEVGLQNGHFVRPFRTAHVIPSQGYLLGSRKQKLKPEYVGAPQGDIKAARKAGHAVTDTVEVRQPSLEQEASNTACIPRLPEPPRPPLCVTAGKTYAAPVVGQDRHWMRCTDDRGCVHRGHEHRDTGSARHGRDLSRAAPRHRVHLS